MFFLILGMIFLIPSLWFWIKHHNKTVEKRRYYGATLEPTDASVASWIFLTFSILWIFFTVILVNAVVYVDQVRDQETIVKLEANKTIFETRAEDLTERLSDLLETKYPDHEKAIFDNLTPNNAELVFVAYPQLRAIEGFNKLADQIRSLRDAIYKQDVKIEERERSIRVRNRNIFFLTWLLPQ